MSEYGNLIQDMVKTAGLPKDFWPAPPLYEFSPFLDFKLDQSKRDLDLVSSASEKFPCHPRIVQAIEKLPAAQILGQAVLTRPCVGITTMTTIAEAAVATFGPDLAGLLWIIVRVLEDRMKNNVGKYYTWRKKVSFLELFEHCLTQEQALLREANLKIAQEFDIEKDIRYYKDFSYRAKDYREKLENIQSDKNYIAEKLRMIANQKEEVYSALEQESSLIQRMELEVKRELESELELEAKPDLEAKRYPSGRRDFLIRMNEDKPEIDRDSQSQDYFVSGTSYISAENTEKGIWTFIFDRIHRQEIELVLDWLEFTLGSQNFRGLSTKTVVRVFGLDTDNPPIISNNLQNCWRQKLVGGNILDLTPLDQNQQLVKSSSELQSGANDHSLTSILSQRYPDSLVLTAAALWSLFDNELEERPGCRCTLKAPGGAFLHCKELWEGWLVWHVTMSKSEELLCDGNHCHLNVEIPFLSNQNWHPILETTPCVLGWMIQTREQPTALLWDTLPVSQGFKGKKLSSYSLKQVQVQVQLTAPLPAGPQIGAVATFAKTQYKVEQSIHDDSWLAIGIAASINVLIYDELRQIHYFCDGADIIELICLQYLREIDSQQEIDPLFYHSTAMKRLYTWYHTNFHSPSNRRIPGDQLVRQATAVVLQLYGETKNACKVSLPYWPLEEIMRGGPVTSLKRPNNKETSWEDLAGIKPPVVLAVGSIHKRVIPEGIEFAPQNSNAQRALRHLRVFKGPALGIITDLPRMERWLRQAEFVQRMTLLRSGRSLMPNDHILEIQKRDQDEQRIEKVLGKLELCTKCSESEKGDCVHLVI